MTFYTDGVVPWNSLDNNTRAPLSSELEAGYPCGAADRTLHNWTAGWPIGQVWNVLLEAGLTPSTSDLTQLFQAIRSMSLEPLIADTTFYVRTDGDDENDGSANTSAGAFRTLQGAYEAIRMRYFANGYTVTFQLGQAGTYAGILHSTWPGKIKVLGNASTPEDYILSNVTSTKSCVATYPARELEIVGASLQGAPGTDQRCAWNFGGNLTLNDVDYRTTGAGDLVGILTEANGQTVLVNDQRIYASSVAYINAQDGGVVYLGTSGVGATLALQSTLDFSLAFAFVVNAGRIIRRSSTITGSATGKRYEVRMGGIVDVAGAGDNYFPGDEAGSEATGGQYA